MDFGHDLESGHSELISAQRLSIYNETTRKNKASDEIELRFSSKDLLTKIMNTTKKYSAIETVTVNFEIFFTGIGIIKYKRKLNLCKSQIDELRIFQNSQKVVISITSRIEVAHGNFGRSDSSVQEPCNIPADCFVNATNRDDLHENSSSIYCTGFQSFLDKDDVCNTIDANLSILEAWK